MTAEETKPKKSTEPETALEPAKRKKTKRRTVSHGHVHILATFNNTLVTVTDTKGNALTSASSGGSGFRGSKKGTGYAAQIAMEKAISSAKQAYGLDKVEVFVKGVGLGREAAIRTLINQKVQLENLKDITTIPHGGTRPRRPKRN